MTLPDRWDTVLDPVEQAFTAQVPAGWRGRAWLVRTGGAIHTLVHAVSPDGSTAIALSDPAIPPHVEPSPVPPPPGYRVHPYVPVDRFLPGWAHHRYGALPGFALGQMTPCPPLLEVVARAAMSSGAQNPWITAARLPFSWTEPTGRVHGLLLASCTALPPVWIADVHAITTLDPDPDRLLPTALAMLTSRRATPAMHARQMQERAASAANHQAVMQQLDRNAALLRSHHQQAMAAIDASGRAHQERMATLTASHDAANQAWSARQASQDAGHQGFVDALRGPPTAATPPSEDEAHRRFLDLIAGERTVVDPHGEVHKVADGFDRYFRRRRDGVWIGTKDGRDLSGLPGVDPADFDEAIPKR